MQLLGCLSLWRAQPAICLACNMTQTGNSVRHFHVKVSLPYVCYISDREYGIYTSIYPSTLLRAALAPPGWASWDTGSQLATQGGGGLCLVHSATLEQHLPRSESLSRAPKPTDGPSESAQLQVAAAHGRGERARLRAPPSGMPASNEFR
jgi:hypothetical protein